MSAADVVPAVPTSRGTSSGRAASDPAPVPAPRGRRGRAVPGARGPSRRDEIIAAAALFFAEHGYHNVGMRDVAEAVGIRGASLYNHFRSKEEILFDIALSVTRGSVEGYLSLLDEPGTPAARLAALLRAHLIHLAGRRVEYRVMLTDLRTLTPEHRDVVLGYTRYYQRRVRDTISAGCRHGELEVANVRRAAVALMDMMNGISGWFDPALDAGSLAADYIRYGVGGMLHYTGDVEELVRVATSMTDALGFVVPAPVTPAAVAGPA